MKHDETLSEKKWIEAETKGDNLQARKKTSNFSWDHDIY